MRIAAITDEIDFELCRALDVMAEYDIYNAELRGIGATTVSRMTIDEILAMKRVLDAKAVRTIGIASPFYKTSLPGTGNGSVGPLHGASDIPYSEQRSLLLHMIEAAQILEAPFIRTFTFWRHGELTEEIEARIVDAYQEPAELASKAGVTLLIENEPSCYIGTGVETARIVDKIGASSVKILWDPANAVFADERPFPGGYEAVKAQMAHVHVKDAARTAKGDVECVVVGKGAVDWPAHLRALKSDGYQGYLSLETHYNGLGDKEPSSRLCLERLIRMVEGLE